ncbi:MAG: prenyltransferase/squalene oxidase repeat-containing protein, partial [Planctomycetota bacterium]
MLRRRWHAPLAGTLLATLVGAQQPAVEASNTKEIHTGAPDTKTPASSEKITRRNIANAEAKARLMSKAWELRVDASVQRGLTWLAEHQNKKGFWTGLIGHKRETYYMPLRPLEEQLRTGTGHMGVTALCGMAFLAGGHLPRRGKYGNNVQKTVDAVLSCVQENGVITVAGSRMYSHAFATLFLAQVYGMSRDPRIKKGLERATHIIVDCQNEHGAWRYNPFSREADLSVTVCQLQALRSARNIGIQIPKSTIDRAVQYVKDSRVMSGYDKGLFYYKIHGRSAYRKPRQY